MVTYPRESSRVRRRGATRSVTSQMEGRPTLAVPSKPATKMELAHTLSVRDLATTTHASVFSGRPSSYVPVGWCLGRRASWRLRNKRWELLRSNLTKQRPVSRFLNLTSTSTNRLKMQITLYLRSTSLPTPLPQTGYCVDYVS